MNIFKKHCLVLSLCATICLFGCEGYYEHEYVLVNKSSNTIVIFNTRHISVKLDSLHYIDSLFIDTLIIYPNQMSVVNTQNIFGGIPKKKQSCSNWINWYQFDTIYEVNQNVYLPVLLASNLIWNVTRYDRNEGQQCTSVINGDAIDNSDF